MYICRVEEGWDGKCWCMYVYVDTRVHAKNIIHIIHTESLRTCGSVEHEMKSVAYVGNGHVKNKEACRGMYGAPRGARGARGYTLHTCDTDI